MCVFYVVLNGIGLFFFFNVHYFILLVRIIRRHNNSRQRGIIMRIAIMKLRNLLGRVFNLAKSNFCRLFQWYAKRWYFQNESNPCNEQMHNYKIQSYRTMTNIVKRYTKKPLVLSDCYSWYILNGFYIYIFVHMWLILEFIWIIAFCLFSLPRYRVKKF